MPSSSRAERARARRIGRAAVIVAVAAVVLLAGCYALLPWLTAALAPRLADPFGLDDLEISVGRPGLSGMAVESLTVVSGRFVITARDARITYHAGGLAGGRLDAIHVGHLSVRVGPPPESAVSGTGAVPTPRAVFAAVPADRVAVETLQVEVPAVNFLARGTLRLAEGRLQVALQGLSPPDAERFGLTAALGADGRVTAALTGTTAAAPAGTAPGGTATAEDEAVPYLQVTSEVTDTLALHGDVALRGFPLELAAAVAGVAPGSGRVDGVFEAVLPWPPEPWDAAAVSAQGRFSGEWVPADGGWRVGDAALTWELERGGLHGSGGLTMHYDERPFQVRAAFDRLALDGRAGAGTLTVAGEGSTGPLADLSWVLEPDALVAEGTVTADQALLSLAGSAGGLPPGDGELGGELSVRLPWPLPAELDTLRPPAHGTVRAHWRASDGGLFLDGVTGDWTLSGGVLSGSIGGGVGYREYRASVGLSVERAELDGARLEVGGALTAARGNVTLPFSLRHDVGAGSGELTVDGRVRVDGGLAGKVFDRWSLPWDVTAGSLTAGARLRWRADTAVHGTMRLDMKEVAGRYEDYVVSGVNGEPVLSAGADGAWTLAPALLRLGSVDTGVEISDVRTGVAWKDGTATVETSTGEVLGGGIRVGPFTYDVAAGNADLVVGLTDVDLAKVLALEGDDVSGTGRLDGTLPVRVRGHAPAIVAGRVSARPPGGVIRVSPALAGGTGQPGLDFALRALQDFRYSALGADVAYTTDGDLTLAVQLEGRNPAIEQGRPIHYNLSVNENVPTLLKSLRLQDEVTRRIERRVTD